MVGEEINKNKRRTSIDRSTKATLILTVHCLIVKSSTNDLAWSKLKLIWTYEPFNGTMHIYDNVKTIVMQ